MIRDLIKWVVPGLATVLGGTSLCLAMTSTSMTTDLTDRANAVMSSGGYDWAELSFDARDVALSGTTTDVLRLKAAIARLDGVPGIRAVASDVTLAPLAKPYLFTASIAPEGPTLIGGVPDETTRQKLLQRAQLATASLDLRSGMPERGAWVAGAQFAIDNLKYFDEGEISLSDTTVNLVGRAASERDYRDLLVIMRAGAPSGLQLGTVKITPALVEPYQWSASFDGKRIDVTGFVPDDSVAERLRTADVSGLPVATGLALGSGEPADFSELSLTLLEQLAKLEYGSASIIGTQGTLTGAPPTLEVAQAVTDTLQSSGSIVTLEPPHIDDYWMSATRQPGGLVIFDGYAPDEATRTALGQQQGADVTWLKLGRGAPERYQSGVDFGLAALGQMQEGRFALRDNVITLSGIAQSADDYTSLRTSLAEGAPQGLVLAMSEVRPPRAEPYSWQVSKETSGDVTLSGLVPNPEAETTLLASAGAGAVDTLAYASGEPGNFLGSAQTALGLLPLLQNGAISFDGSGWTVTGTPNSAPDRTALDTVFADQQLAAAGWSMALAEPRIAVAAAAPIAEPVVEPVPEVAAQPTPVTPYVWSASKAGDGTITLSGNVPATATQRVMAVRAGGNVVDQTQVSPGAPEGFIEDALAGLSSLAGLSEGNVGFDGTTWSVTGQLLDALASDVVGNAITSGSTPPDEWNLDLTEAQVAVVEPEPAPVVEPPAPQPTVAPPATPPVQPVPEASPAPAPGAAAPAEIPAAPAADSDVIACAAPVAQFSARNAIFFQSGAASIAAESNAALDELAIDLAACPSATVHIEGHTDSDGDDALNMALSVARAEAVVNALAQRGVAADRLYAVGYGESAPIADNATAQGKRINRRIVVTVRAGD